MPFPEGVEHCASRRPRSLHRSSVKWTALTGVTPGRASKWILSSVNPAGRPGRRSPPRSGHREPLPRLRGPSIPIALQESTAAGVDPQVTSSTSPGSGPPCRSFDALTAVVSVDPVLAPAAIGTNRSSRRARLLMTKPARLEVGSRVANPGRRTPATTTAYVRSVPGRTSQRAWCHRSGSPSRCRGPELPMTPPRHGDSLVDVSTRRSERGRHLRHSARPGLRSSS